MEETWWVNKSVWVSGATGAWGTEICRQLLALPVRRAIAFCRGEHRAATLYGQLQDDRLRIRLGDIRDRERVTRSMVGADLVIHAAALKRVDNASHDCLEIVKTNVLGTLNIVEACIDLRPQKALFISSDKSVAARNIYGGTKFVGEHLWHMGNEYAPPPRPCKFSVLRCGNALGSTGSVLHIWKRQRDQRQPLTLTDPEMTRFHITLPDAVTFLLESLEHMDGGETFIPQMPAYTIRDLAWAFAGPEYPIVEIGSRGLGEKQHEQLMIDGLTSESTRRLSVAALQQILTREGWI